MLSKKSSSWLVAYANLHPLCYTHQSHPPQRCRKSCRHTSFTAQQHARQYAHHSHSHSHSHSHRHGHGSGHSNDAGHADMLQWPEAITPHTTPTPYQVLKCARGEPYTKQRFYALVKLYHPDHCHSASPIAHLPLHIRLERYRMLVAAHDILSDIEKRKAYDAWGHGWAGHHRTPSSPATYDWQFDRRRWASDPRYNATWEDWERWRHENDRGTDSDARTIQLSNFAFISLIFAFVSIGGVVQGTRFTTFNSSVIERRDQIHREASTTLQRSKNATISGDRDERIRTFLDHREAQVAGEVSYSRLLPPAQTCSPDATPR